MGKIKSKLIKKTAVNLSKRDMPFTKNFEENKRILGKTMPNKKMRNQIAGYIVRLKRREKNEIEHAK